MLVYLDQNYASRIAKHVLGQTSHQAFGEVLAALRAAGAQAPPSPFHVLETRGGYLLPTLKELFGELAGGRWVRPWQEVVRRQAEWGARSRDDLLTAEGSWDAAATLDPLGDLLDVPLHGSVVRRRVAARDAIAMRLELSADRARSLPFAELLARLLAFRSADAGRADQPGDLTDLIMGATVGPYVDALATDRYLAEILGRVGHDRPVFSGRRPDVLRFAGWLRDAAPGAS